MGVEAVVTEVLMTSQRADIHKLLSEPKKEKTDLTQEKVLLILLIWPLQQLVNTRLHERDHRFTFILPRLKKL